MTRDEKLQDRLLFTMTVMFMFCLFGHNLRKGEPTREKREKEWLDKVRAFTPPVYSGDAKEGLEEQAVGESRTVPKKKTVHKPRHKGKVTVTQYNPVKEQCDLDPLVTADNSMIDLVKLRRKELKWVAVSRDLVGIYRYGDIIELTATGKGSKRINGRYIVHDTMNPRFTNRVDILTAVGEEMGMWENVTVKLVSRKQRES